jgi:hypothetical protein
VEVVAGYRSQSDAEFGFRPLKDPHVVSFSPMHHPTDHNIRVHAFTCPYGWSWSLTTASRCRCLGPLDHNRSLARSSLKWAGQPASTG